jgi:O-antigen ligase
VRRGRSAAILVVLLFLLANLALRVWTTRSLGTPIEAAALVVVAAAGACLLRAAWLGTVLVGFGASFFLYGFHSYSVRNQVFEIAVTALASVLALRIRSASTPSMAPGARVVLGLGGLYALHATFSLLLLPPRVLEHRAFLEGGDLARAALLSYPKDPLYPIAGVDRLWLFLAFAGLLSLQPDATALCRRLVRGIAWAVVAAVVLGLMDFAGLVSLARYNLSHVFFGGEYRRLQSTFGNPGWFACFVACALPFVLTEWSEARSSRRLVLAVALPLVAASLLLAGARAAWLAVLLQLLGFAASRLAARRLGRPFSPAGSLGKAALAGSIAVLVLLATLTYWPAASPSAGEEGRAAPGRLQGLAREILIRGLGSSPRRVAAAYALELARERPLLGLGYESFNMHLQAQLAIPGSPVTRVVNTAVAQDPAEKLFDDSHSTYLQALSGTGALGLALWLAFAVSGLGIGVLAFLRTPRAETAALALALLVFHFYGLFQGMAYVPVIFFLLFVELGFALTLDTGPQPAWLVRASRWSIVLLGALVLAALPAQFLERGYPSLKRALSVEAYLPDEAAPFEGCYPPETGPLGEFRWTARRAIVNVPRAAPFRLSITCEHPDLEREPVTVSFRLEGRDAGTLVCRLKGTQELRFEPHSPGALRVSVSRTFRPGGSDRRDLGVALSPIRWD